MTSFGCKRLLAGSMEFAYLRLMKQWILPFLLLGILAGCARIKDPEFRSIDHFAMKGFDLSKAGVGFRVTYYNPNNFGVTVKQAVADIYIDTVYLGRFSQDSAIEVGRMAVFSIPLSGSVPFRKLLELDPKSLGQRDIYLKADGSVKVGKAGIFVTRPVHYEGRHRLDELQIRL